MASWLLRTFRNWSLGFMRFLYRTYLMPLTDYCSHLWSPTKFNEIETLEAIPRSWTRHCIHLRGMHFWDRIKALGISSIQRRHERYRIILCWKILEGLVPQQGNIKSVRRPQKGRLVLEPTIKSSSKAKSLKESSFTIQAARLFNSLPRSIRDYRTTDGGTLNGFKRLLGTYINPIPDLPRNPA